MINAPSAVLKGLATFPVFTLKSLEFLTIAWAVPVLSGLAPSKIPIVFLEVSTAPDFLVLIHNDVVRPGAQLACQMHPHVALASGRPVIMDDLHRSLITLVHMLLQLSDDYGLIDRWKVPLPLERVSGWSPLSVFCQALFPEKSVKIPCFYQGIFPAFGGR